MTNPGIIAVEIGLVRMFLQLPLPHFVDTAVDNLGACTSRWHGPGGGHPGGRALKTVIDPGASIWWRCGSCCYPACAWPA